MKLRVCKQFKDKNTGMTYTIGRIIEVSDKRGAEILANPQKLAEMIEDPAVDIAEVPTQKSASKPRRKKGVKRDDDR